MTGSPRPDGSATTPTEVNLVFEGGGIRGIGLVGALAPLLERGLRPRHVAGTSAGAIVSTLLAAGYGGDELREVTLAFDFGRLRDKDWLDRIPLVGAGVSILRDHGIYEGEAFLEAMRALLAAKGVRTFGDLADPAHPGDPLLGYRAQVVVSDLTEKRLLVLPQDAAKLGVAPDELEVALAVRASMSIPVFFEPVRFTNPRTGRVHLLVDGGMLSNFPVWLFDEERRASGRPTLGLKLIDPEPGTAPGAGPRRSLVAELAGAVAFARSLADTVLEARDRLYLEQVEFARTIGVPTLGIGPTEFDLPRERALALYDAGREAAERFLAGWRVEDDLAAGRAAVRRPAGLVRRRPYPSRRRRFARLSGQRVAVAAR
jgi:NTE family protein